MTVSGGRRVISTNALPTHPTGVYPVASSDPASRYDRNPNTIRAQSLRYDLTSTPSGMGTNCIGGEVGVMLDGVPLFDGFDAGGRDAGAWEVQDACAGHPQMSGEYHYHDLSPCLPSWDAKTVVGFALDGYPITGPRIAAGDILTTSDLDECHGMTSEIVLDGKTVTSYHYVMTQDFPYSVSCFRGTAIRAPGIPG
ncbi:MAG: YHYH protein [Chloroflexi bacterium]|nr:MAG: YHYH protein [Chloroflexota bacterium]